MTLLDSWSFRRIINQDRGCPSHARGLSDTIEDIAKYIAIRNSSSIDLLKLLQEVTVTTQTIFIKSGHTGE